MSVLVLMTVVVGAFVLFLCDMFVEFLDPASTLECHFE